MLWLMSLALLAVCQADTLVQLNVNRPYNDVSEKFVSFAVRPEDLYEALDGKNRKAVTCMAAHLGDAYVKLVGDFYFASSAPQRLRNPTKIIWKGFNRWTRAVNWTMIIPVPYAPDEWDSMHTLKILNTSYMVGITDCIWQLGTDFGTSRARDYVQELTTLKLMTDTFGPYVSNWRVMGADISAGSSAEETRKYVNMSRDINAAFGWTQPANMLPSSSLGNYIFDSDPALRALQQLRVPLWLTVPDERKEKRLLGDETTDALRWAQTLGDAASGGFDVVFKRMTLQDFDKPNFSYYVTALFKKVMGSRVFPAHPLNAFAPTNKLYTHCANAVSGGLAFMVVNTEDQPTTITLRSRLPSSDIWQYVLTAENGKIRLNNGKLSSNSTLRPQTKRKDSKKLLQLITPSMSVGFWVLPHVNVEHCQFSEHATDSESAESSPDRNSDSGYSSADRLLQRLIEETAVSRGSLQSTLNRPRRFVLDNPEMGSAGSLLDRLLQPFNVAEEKHLDKRQAKADDKPKLSVRPYQAIHWFRNVMEQSREAALSHRRGRRSPGDYSGPFFYNRQGKKMALTKKITEIRKPERKVKPLFDLAEFDEEKFFKNIGEQPEPPPYTRLPEGDVHLKHIESPDGEESEMQPEPEQIVHKKRRPARIRELKILPRSREESVEDVPEATKDEELPKQRLPPTEFFEALPAAQPQAKRLNLGATLNSLLFPQPFSNKASVSKSQVKTESSLLEDPEQEVEPVEGDVNRKRSTKGRSNANDFFEAQRELGKHFLSHIKDHEQEFSLANQNLHDLESQAEESVKDIDAHKPAKLLSSIDKAEDYFAGKSRQPVPAPKRLKPLADKSSITSWWDMPAFRQRRALPMPVDFADEALNSNVIHKDDREELLPLGRYSTFEYRVDLPTVTPPKQTTESIIMKINSSKDPGSTCRKVTLSDNIVTTVKSKVSKIMSFISRHMSEWYNTLTKHLDTDPGMPQPENAID